MVLALLVALASTLPHESSPVRIDTSEAWRTVDDESAPYLLGVISAVDTDSRGRVYLLDRQQQQLVRFDVEGNYDGVVVGPGPGPGELERTFWFSITTDDRLVIPRIHPPSISLLQADGTFVETVVFQDDDGAPAFTMLLGSPASHARGYVLEGEITDFESGASTRVLAVFDRAGKRIAEIARLDKEDYDFAADRIRIVERDAFFPGARRALAPDGRLYVAPDRNAYRIEIHAPTGELTDEVDLAVPGRRRSPEEMERAKKSHAISASPGMRIPEVDFEIEETAPPIDRLHVIGDELWVRLDSGALPEGCFARYAIHRLDGAFVETRDLYVPWDPDHDRVILLRDGRVVVLVNVQDAQRAASAASNVRVGEDLVDHDDESLEAVEMIVAVYETRRSESGSLH